MLKPDVVAVILNYKRPDDTVECVDALRRSTFEATKIIVVNNDLSDKSTDALLKKYPDLELIHTGKNYGYAGGMNIGLKRALQLRSKYLFVANSDTVVEKDVISLLVAAMENHPNTAAASGTICYYDDPKKIWCAEGEINYWRATASYRTALPAEHRLREGGILPVTFISGCAFLVRSSALESVGLFDERFFMYLEDTELCSRFVRNGYDLLYLPAAIIRHKVNDGGIAPLPLYFSVRNRYLFLAVAASWFPRIVGFTYLSIVTAAKFIFWSLTRKDSIPRRSVIQTKPPHTCWYPLSFKSVSPSASDHVNPYTLAGENTSAPRGRQLSAIPSPIIKHSEETSVITLFYPSTFLLCRTSPCPSTKVPLK